MASFNVPNPYQTGVVLNSDRQTNFYFLQLAKQRAKEDAFDGYLNDLQKSATPAGMRTQDVQGFTEKAKQWTRFGIEKKREIQNPTLDGGRALAQFRGLHTELLGDVASSKGEYERSKEWQAIRNDPEKLRRLKEETISRMSLSDKSIYDKEYQPFDPSAIAFKAKPFDIQAKEQFGKYLLNGLDTKATLLETRPHPTDRFRKIDVFEYKRSKQDFENIAAKSINAFNSDDSFHDEVIQIADEILPKPSRFDKSKIEASPLFDRYNTAFRKVAGRDMSDDRDVAVAYGILETDKYAREEKEVENKQALIDEQNAEWRRRQKISNADTQANIRLRKSLGGSEEEKDELINDVYSEISELARDNPYIRPQIMSPQAQKIVMDFAEVGAGRKLSADNIKVVDPGNGQLQVFQSKKDKDVLIGTLSAKSVNLKGQPSVKEKRAVIGQQPKPKTKNATVNVPSFLRK